MRKKPFLFSPALFFHQNEHMTFVEPQAMDGILTVPPMEITTEMISVKVFPSFGCPTLTTTFMTTQRLEETRDFGCLPTRDIATINMTPFPETQSLENENGETTKLVVPLVDWRLTSLSKILFQIQLIPNPNFQLATRSEPDFGLWTPSIEPHLKRVKTFGPICGQNRKETGLKWSSMGSIFITQTKKIGHEELACISATVISPITLGHGFIRPVLTQLPVLTNLSPIRHLLDLRVTRDTKFAHGI